MEGDLIVADKEAQYNLYKALKPVLTTAGSGPIIIITPLPRFVNQGCCSTPLHVTNRDKPEFNLDITHSLAEVRNNWRSFLFVDNLRRISIVNPQPIFDTLPDGNGWGMTPSTRCLSSTQRCPTSSSGTPSILLIRTLRRRTQLDRSRVSGAAKRG